MDYRILLQEENDAVRERYELSMERQYFNDWRQYWHTSVLLWSFFM